MDSSVGCSVGVSMSTKWARQKVDVTAWCTLPSYSDRASREVVLAECYEQVSSEVKARLEEVADRFFPDADWEEPS